MEENRERQIVRASIVSVIGNAALAFLKACIGIATSSIAITLDAVNSLADALSSIIAIVGTKVANRPADYEHPFGYGRVEYFSSITIAALICSAGGSALMESIRSIRHPATPTYSLGSLVIVAIAAVVKALLGVYLQRVGERVSSASLVGSGTDSKMDALVSLATLIAAIIYLTMGLQLESWLAAGISILICNSGVRLLLDTLSKLLGERVDPEIVASVEREALAVEGVRLASGLVLMDLGPNRAAGAIHVTVDGDMTVAEFDEVARAVQNRVYKKTGVMLSGVTPYATSLHDERVTQVRADVSRIVWGYEHVVELRGLYIDPDAGTVRFDAIVEYGSGDPKNLREAIIDACEERCPGWTFNARVLPDIGD